MSIPSRKVILLNPGPVVVDERVRSALSGPDMCHREPDFSDLMTRTRELIVRACGGDESFTSVLLTGSGTAALEAVMATVISPTEKVLILSNGHYGERIAEMARVHQLQHDVLDFGWGSPFETSSLRSKLESEPAITHLACVHHETSTGMLNPVAAVGTLAASLGRKVIVDAISSMGGEQLSVEANHVTWCVGTANKCLEGIPGISFVCGPRSEFQGLSNIEAKTVYLNLARYFVAQEEQHQPPFTPAVQVVMALETALRLFLEETLTARHLRYSQRAMEVRDGLQHLGFKFLLSPEYRSCTLTSVYLPDGVSYAELHDFLLRQNFVIYAGQETLKNSVFRIANMGQISSRDIQDLLKAVHSFCEAVSK